MEAAVARDHAETVEAMQASKTAALTQCEANVLREARLLEEVRRAIRRASSSVLSDAEVDAL